MGELIGMLISVGAAVLFMAAVAKVANIIER